MSMNKHPNDDGQELYEEIDSKKVLFTPYQRYCHFDFMENQKKYEKIAILESRKNVYKSEADPLYMEWQYDQTDEAEQAWRDKVAEIKARYPLPTE
ncbi:hypothetical protein [Marinomonas sp. TW1]|uniref:hypothetical protein n=1 Tax=Marinomonas sp. TW1 TaxID=1561203 RepID=UPI0007AEF352|nr:hypothetical protein [Marinomonas sp. TW1]KZN12595.1 hypothetical protein OA79_15060 [Marinomonas sp. TW1]